jgi:hypothetical protein
MAALTQARQWYQQLNEPLHAAAVQQHLQSTTNSTIGNVSVVVGVPKGVDEKRPENMKVLLYMHGKWDSHQSEVDPVLGACPVHMSHVTQCVRTLGFIHPTRMHVCLMLHAGRHFSGSAALQGLHAQDA